MTIEQTLTRIAEALEKIADLQAGRNLILEATSAAAEVAGAAVEKASTRGRRKKEDSTPDAAPDTTPQSTEVKTETTKTADATPPAETTPPAAEVKQEQATNAPTVEQLQARAPNLSKKFGKEKITGLIKQINPEHGNISTMTDSQRVAFWQALDALEVGADADAEFA